MGAITLAAYAWLFSKWYPGIWRNALHALVSAVTFRRYRVDRAVADESTVGMIFGFLYTAMSWIISVAFYRLVKRVTGFGAGGSPIGYLNASLYTMESWLAALLLLMAVCIPVVILGGLIFNAEVHAFLGGIGIILGVILLIFAPPTLCCYLLYTKAFVWPIAVPYWAQALFFAAIFLFVKLGSRISPRLNSAAQTMTA